MRQTLSNFKQRKLKRLFVSQFYSKADKIYSAWIDSAVGLYYDKVIKGKPVRVYRKPPNTIAIRDMVEQVIGRPASNEPVNQTNIKTDSMIFNILRGGAKDKRKLIEVTTVSNETTTDEISNNESNISLPSLTTPTFESSSEIRKDFGNEHASASIKKPRGFQKGVYYGNKYGKKKKITLPEASPENLIFTDVFNNSLTEKKE